MTQLSTFSFRRFMISRGIGALCDQFLMFAVPLSVLKFTGSTSLSALSFVIEWIPRVIFFPIAGSLLDGRDLKRTFLGLDALRIILLLTTLLTIDPLGPFYSLTTLMAIMSICYVINFVSIESVIPNNIAPEKYAHAHSWVQTVEQLSQVVGPGIAILIFSAASIKGILLACAGLFLLSLFNMLSIHINSAQASDKKRSLSVLKDNLSAVEYLVHDKKILFLSAMTWVVNIVYGVILSITPAVVIKLFHESENAYGIMQTTAALFSVLLFYLVPKISARLGIGLVGRVSFFIILAGGFLLGVSNSFYLYLLFYAIVIAFDGAFSVYIRTMRSTLIPKNILTRVIGMVGMLNLLSIPIGGAVVSALSGSIGLPAIILLCSGVSLLFALLLLLAGRYKLGWPGFFPG